ncbi:uncharacterized protein LOC135075476 isoform X1 [Ostrinia nubilalis]|uniref:uncharacterized protein LOC135075476 isoform X1 n=1 Tax=Ostrinia nubilalis TaxID=29057 RepID=UPI0030824C39
MRGPYRVVKVLPSGRYELKLLSGARGKTTQAAAQYMVPWKGEWCPESCAAFFESYEGDDDDVEAGPSASHADSEGTQDTPEEILRADLALSDDDDPAAAVSPTFTGSSGDSTQDTPEDILRADLALSDDDDPAAAVSPTFTGSSGDSTQDTPEDILRADLALSDDDDPAEAVSPTFTSSSRNSS